MTDFIKYLQHEWTTISGAPFAFILFGALVCGLAYAASSWKHRSVIDLLRERLAAKDQQLDEYRERLQLAPARGSEFSRQSHAELQSTSLKFVADLRGWLAAQKADNTRRQHQQWVAMTNATDEKQKKQLWDADTDGMLASSSALGSGYDAQFKVKAIVLRDELRARGVSPDAQTNARRMYEHPTNMIGMGMVADDLERMARLLK